MSRAAEKQAEKSGAAPQAVQRKESSPEAASAGPQGAWTKYVQSVQAKGGAVRETADPSAVRGTAADQSAQRVAAQGVQNNAAGLPHKDRIQAAFGHHDVSGVKSHTGGEAAAAGDKLGAEAFATGDDVAFKSSPDLHTAAHEAAHVVQQRAGVQLKGGVGEVGDRFEQNADAVADKVVKGQSAEGLLDQVTGGGGKTSGGAGASGGVQALHGNLNAPAAKENSAKDGETVRDAATRLQPGERDADFNPKEKVAFEAELAAVIAANQDAYRAAVEQVSKGLLGYLAQREKLGMEQGLAHLEKDAALNRMMDPRDAVRSVRALLGNDAKADAGTIQGIMGAAGQDIGTHMQVHGNFKDEVLAGDYEQKVSAELGNVAQAVAGKAQAGEQHFLRRRADVVDYLDPNDAAKKDRDANKRGRKTATDKTGKYLGNEGEGRGPEKFRGGMDVWIVNEGNKFVQEARLRWNMPIGAGISGTTTDLLEVAAIGGVTGGEALLQYVSAVIGYIVGNKHHSFHEVASAAKAAGVSYDPGNYRGLYPKALEATSDFQALKAKYPKFLGDSKS